MACLLSYPWKILDPFVIKEVNKAVDALRSAALTAEFNRKFILNEVCDFFNVSLNESKIHQSSLYFYDDVGVLIC